VRQILIKEKLHGRSARPAFRSVRESSRRTAVLAILEHEMETVNVQIAMKLSLMNCATNFGFF